MTQAHTRAHLERRDPDEAGMGYPIRVLEMLNTLEGTRYLARGAVKARDIAVPVLKQMRKAVGIDR